MTFLLLREPGAPRKHDYANECRLVPFSCLGLKQIANGTRRKMILILGFRAHSDAAVFWFDDIFTLRSVAQPRDACSIAGLESGG